MNGMRLNNKLDVQGMTAGSILGRIIDSAEGTHELAAKRLRISASLLSRIIHGHARVTRRLVETNSWRKVFEVYYGPGWRKERKNFEAALEFRRKNPGPRARRPSGIGAVIWQIIGARDEAVVTAARRLGCTVGQIKDVLYGGRQTAEAWVRWYHWKEKLALHYPLAWNNYAEEFEKRLAGESRRRSCGIGAPGNDRSQSPDAPAEPSGLTS